MLLALVFGAIFLTVIGALSSYVLTQNRIQSSAAAKARGLTIAEAGLEYYKWFLAHNPGNLTNGTGQAGPYAMNYNDPEGGKTGTISLAVSGNTSCGQVTSIDIRSTGTPIEDAGGARTIFARYARPTVAQYSYIVNDSVWAGDDRSILGPYHSNGGVRMDGDSNSPVTSSLSSWTCTSSYGCSFNQTKPGVFGAGSNSELWSYPTPQVDFSAISANFSSLKTTAVASGKYFTDGTNGTSFTKGVHLIFNADGTLTVKRVTGVTALNDTPINSGTDRNYDYSVIASEALIGTYTLPASCGLVFVEDNAWVEGTITKKVTVVVADTSVGGRADAVLPNNITYGAYDGTAGLTLIAEHDVLIGASSPSDMTLNGVFIAQSGAFGRNLIWNSSGSACNSTYEPRGTLTILGSTVSNLRTGTRWTNVSGCGADDSAGYQTRTDAYDRRLATDPPPFTPYVSTDYKFVDWREQ
jgi:hypothetical protein